MTEVRVRPTNTPTYRAVKWTADGAALPTIERWAEEHDWLVKQTDDHLRIVRHRGRGASRNIRSGYWIILLGTSGMFLVLSNARFKIEYEVCE